MSITGITKIKDGVPITEVVKGTPSVSLGETSKPSKVEVTEQPAEKKRFVRKK